MDPAVTLQVAVLALIGTLAGAALGAGGTLLAQLPQSRRERRKLKFEQEKEHNKLLRDDHFRYSEYKRETYAELVGSIQRWRSAIITFHLRSKTEEFSVAWTSLRPWITGVADDRQPMGSERDQIDLILGRIQLLSDSVHDFAYWTIGRYDWLTLTLCEKSPRSFIAEMVENSERQNIQLLEGKITELAAYMRGDLVSVAVEDEKARLSSDGGQ